MSPRYAIAGTAPHIEQMLDLLVAHHLDVNRVYPPHVLGWSGGTRPSGETALDWAIVYKDKPAALKLKALGANKSYELDRLNQELASETANLQKENAKPRPAISCEQYEIAKSGAAYSRDSIVQDCMYAITGNRAMTDYMTHFFNPKTKHQIDLRIAALQASLDRDRALLKP